MAKLFRWALNQFNKLGLLPEYAQAIARQWTNILFGESILAVVFLIWWSLAGPSDAKLIVAFVAAMLVAGYYAWRPLHVRLAPKGKITQAHTREEFVERLMFSSTGLPAQGEVVDERNFVQIEFKCLTEAPLYECTGYLKEVRKLSNGNWEPAEFKSLILKWDNENEVKQITQHPGVEKPLNVISIRRSDNFVELWCFADVPRARLAKFFDGIAEQYEFDILITYSDRIDEHPVSFKPASACLSVDMSGNPYAPKYAVREI